MSTSRKPATKQRIRLALRARRLARENAAVVVVLAVVVATAVTAVFTRRVLAAKHEIRVLDCPVAGAVAHHHDESCFDEDGNLVCTLPERDLHTHDEGCYERRLVCDTAEGEGAHHHGEECYDEYGDLVCGNDESDGHRHDDSCYADVLVCGQEECTEEHVHGDGCWKTVAANEDALEYSHPEQQFQHDVRDKDGKLQLRIDVDAPQGALPKGSSMDVRMLDADKLDLELVQKALDDKAAKERDAKKTDEEKAEVEAGKLLKWQAVDVTFRDSEGNEVQPARDVAVRLTSQLVKAPDGHALVRVEDEAEAARRTAEQRRELEAQGVTVEGASQDDAKPEAHALDQMSEGQLKDHEIKLEEDQVAFEADKSTTYVLATTSLRHEMACTDGATVSICVDAPAEAGIPADAVLDVSRVSPDSDEYGTYVDRTVEAMGAKETDVALASFFDIHIKDGDGSVVQPKAPVDVRIELADIPDAPNGFAAVHFKDAGEGEQAELEQLECGGQDGTVTFAAESFSVYGIVYTVDFGYEVEGQLYEYTLPGGGSVGLRELVEALHVWEGAPRAYDDTAAFMSDVQNVTFSDPSLVWIQQVPAGERKSLGDIVDEQGLEVEYAAGTTEEQKAEWASAEYEDDWVLVSLKPFATTEMLTVTMADGSQRLVAVTDAQGDMQVRAAGDGSDIPDTIPNPAGTTIDLFDYWASDYGSRYQKSVGSWPTGGGDNAGINENHSLKFNPANQQLVGVYADNSSFNGWTGDADPWRGIVTDHLNANGFPDLDSQYGSDSLDYLFDGSSSQSSKESYMGVDQFLYVDEDGYYVFDSSKYYANFDKTAKTVTLEDQNGRSGSARGFWPFGEEVYWHGMHMRTQFSVPEGGVVLNPRGESKAMEFEFQGDDDTWIYIDGILVGDAGGIHNRTKVTINYQTGNVLVTGDHDGETSYRGQDSYPTNLRAIFEQAETDGLVYSGYVADNFESGSNTFKAGTYHTFDMFYLERGGGESNLYIRYNLVSTADFTGHKEYTGGGPLQRDQFQFELVGLDGNYDYSSGTLVPNTESNKAIMPKNATSSLPSHAGDNHGTVASPTYDGAASITLNNVNYDAQIYCTGVTEDGNINFGNAQIPASDEQLSDEWALYNYRHDIWQAGDQSDPEPTPPTSYPPTYHYVIREVVPGNAVNAQGHRYDQCDDAERAAGGFVLGDIVYDGKTYYMAASATSWQATGLDGQPKFDTNGQPVWERGLSKRYFTDATFTQVENDAFVNFDNRYITPLDLQVQKEDGHSHTPLEGAEFTLTPAVVDSGSGAWSTGAGASMTTNPTDSSGQTLFGGLKAGYYILEETTPPEDYYPAENKWGLRIERVATDPTTGDERWHYRAYVTPLSMAGVPTGAETELIPDGDFTITQVVEDEPLPDFSFKVEKQWEGMTGNEPALSGSQVVVTLGRYTIADKAGTLNIVKTGVPSAATPKIRYTVERKDDGGNTYTALDDMPIEISSGWTDPKTIASLQLPPGTYRVGEEIVEDDDRYEHSHNGNASPTGTYYTSDITITDGGTETATFTSSYEAYTLTIVKTGMPSEANWNTTITYTIKQGNDVIRTVERREWDGNPVTVFSDMLKPGTYTVEESVNNSPAGYTHTPTGPQTVVLDSTNGDQTLTFNATYAQGTVEIVQAGLPSGANAYIEYVITDASNNQKGWFNTNNVSWDSTDKTIGSLNLAPGTYYVRLGQCGINNPSGYTNSLTSGADPTTGEFTVTDSATTTVTYTAQPPAQGTLTIVQAGMPSGANANITYEIVDTNNTVVTVNYQPCRFSADNISWDSTDKTIASVNLPPGTYYVRLSQCNISNPSGYTNSITSGADPSTGEFTVTDGATTTVVYTAAPPVRGTLVIIQKVIDAPQGCSGQCTYTSSAFDQQKTCGSSNFTPDGYVAVTEDLAPGTYTLSVGLDNWYLLNNFVNSVTSTEGANGQFTISANTTTTIECTAAVQTRGMSALNNALGALRAFVGEGIANAGAVSETDIAQGTNHAEVTDTVPVERSGQFLGATSLDVRQNVMGSAAATTQAQVTDTTADSGPLRMTDNGNGSYTLEGPTDLGAAPTPADTSKKYLEDTTFTTGNTVTLTTGDYASAGLWQEVVSGLPAHDANGNKYYYFIKKVEETGMPADTEPSVIQDNGKLVLAYRNDSTGIADNTLAVHNKVGNPVDVSLLKVAANTQGQPTSTQLGGATFKLLDIADPTQPVLVTPSIETLDATPQTVTPVNGVFGVGQVGVKLLALQPGSYRLEEVTPPDGYILSGTTTFDFTVNADGTITGTYASGTSLTIPNTPGSELPHSAGIGTVVISIVGIGLVAGGVLLLMRSRRLRLARARVGRHACER